MSHEPVVNIEAVPVNGAGSLVVDPVAAEHGENFLYKDNGFAASSGNNGDSEPPPSCSRKLRKYSFLILVNKYILYAVNCLIWLGGLFLVAFGVWARVEDSTVGYLQLLPFDPVALLIALGSLSVVISFFGCIGSIRENVLFLKIFCGAIGCLFIVELASCVVGFISVNSIKDAVIAKFYTSMEMYDEDDQIRGLVDRIQKDYQCCGAIGPNDWDRNLYYNCTANFNFSPNKLEYPSSSGLPSACGVPASCCRSSPGPLISPGAVIVPPRQQLGLSNRNNNNNNNGPFSSIRSSSSSNGFSSNGNPIASFPGFPLNDQCGFGIRRLQPSEQSSEIFIAGCADHMTESLSQNLLYVAVVALAISCFELISILLAFMLIRRITTVLDYMTYIRSGPFVEVDPSRMTPHSHHHRSGGHPTPLVVIASSDHHHHQHGRGLFGRFSLSRRNQTNSNNHNHTTTTTNNNNNNHHHHRQRSNNNNNNNTANVSSNNNHAPRHTNHSQHQSNSNSGGGMNKANQNRKQQQRNGKSLKQQQHVETDALSSRQSDEQLRRSSASSTGNSVATTSGGGSNNGLLSNNNQNSMVVAMMPPPTSSSKPPGESLRDIHI